jgi:hypothetical protein
VTFVAWPTIGPDSDPAAAVDLARLGLATSVEMGRRLLGDIA